MTRALAIISCLIAALFLVPVQAECVETAEGEPEAEIECCVAICDSFQSEISEGRPNVLPSSGSHMRRNSAGARAQGPICRIAAWILHCVFRE